MGPPIGHGGSSHRASGCMVQATAVSAWVQGAANLQYYQQASGVLPPGIPPDFSQTSLMFSYFSLKMLCSPCTVTKCAVAAGRPAFIRGLSPALFQLAMQKRHKYWCRHNIGARQDFTSFRQTIAVTISANRCSIKNW
jgi:hypothetical protein